MPNRNRGAEMLHKWRALFPTSASDEEVVKICRNCEYDDGMISAAITSVWEDAPTSTTEPDTWKPILGSKKKAAAKGVASRNEEMLRKWRGRFPASTSNGKLLEICQDCQNDNDLISAALDRLWEVSMVKEIDDGPAPAAAPSMPPMGKGAKGGKGEAKPDSRGPPGLSTAADWNCSTCGNTNWARRTTCNMCQSAKPSAVADTPTSITKLGEWKTASARKKKKAGARGAPKGSSTSGSCKVHTEPLASNVPPVELASANWYGGSNAASEEAFGIARPSPWNLVDSINSALPKQTTTPSPPQKVLAAQRHPRTWGDGGMLAQKLGRPVPAPASDPLIVEHPLATMAPSQPPYSAFEVPKPSEPSALRQARRLRKPNVVASPSVPSITVAPPTPEQATALPTFATMASAEVVPIPTLQSGSFHFPTEESYHALISFAHEQGISIVPKNDAGGQGLGNSPVCIGAGPDNLALPAGNTSHQESVGSPNGLSGAVVDVGGSAQRVVSIAEGSGLGGFVVPSQSPSGYDGGCPGGMMGSSAGEGVEVDQSHGKIDRLERKPGNGTLSSAVGKPIRVPCVEYSSKGSGDTNDNGERTFVELIAPTPVKPPNFRRVFSSRAHMPERAYLQECELQVRGEYWGQFSQAVQNAPEPGWRRRDLKTYRVDAINVPEKDAPYEGDVSNDGACVPITMTEAFEYVTKIPCDLRDLKGHMCIWRENLYIMYAFGLSCGCKAKAIMGYKCNNHNWAKLRLCARKVMSMKLYPDVESAQDDDHCNLLYDLGYCYDLFKARSEFDKALEQLNLGQKYRNLHHLIQPCESFAEDNPQEDDAKAALSCFQNHEAEGNACPLNKNLDTILCAEQNEVVDNLYRRVEIIQGPPGTGKSTLIRSITRKHIPWRCNSVTLILAVQNKALDVLVKGFESFVDNEPSKSRMLVLGSHTNPNMGPSAASYTLDSLLPQNTEYAQALADFKTAAKDAGTSKLRRLQKNFNATEIKIAKQMLSSSLILFSTFTELHKFSDETIKRSEIQSRIKFVIVDEAGTVPEWQAALLLMLPNIEKMMWIGDTKQLPPFSSNPLDKWARPSLGFLERVQEQFARAKISIPMLLRQFRMHEDIAQLVSTAFYDKKLIFDRQKTSSEYTGLYWIDYDASQPTHEVHECKSKSGNIVLRINKVPSHRATAASTGMRSESKVGNSFVNATEIARIVEGLSLFSKRRIFDDKTVAVICFYKKQVVLLEDTINNLEKVDLELCQDLSAACASGKLRLQTVDASQGSEANIVILSGVRSNAEGDVGFLAKSTGEKRICVAISRACQALFIVGDKDILASPSARLAFGLLWNSSGSGKPTPKRQLKTLTSFSELRSYVGAQRACDDVLISEVYSGSALPPEGDTSEIPAGGGLQSETHKDSGDVDDGDFGF